MTSWSSILSLSCSCRISPGIRSNYDSGGWAARIIHFSLLVSSTVSITLICQETISLAIRNHSFRPPIEGRHTFRDISSVVIRAKRVHFLQSTVHQIHSLFRSKVQLIRKDRRAIFLTTAKTEGLSRWMWQASIFFSCTVKKRSHTKLIRFLNSIIYPSSDFQSERNAFFVSFKSRFVSHSF